MYICTGLCTVQVSTLTSCQCNMDTLLTLHSQHIASPYSVSSYSVEQTNCCPPLEIKVLPDFITELIPNSLYGTLPVVREKCTHSNGKICS